MLTGRELTQFRKKLLEWFAAYKRDLPWRRTRDPYRIWLSEIMLQQTRVAAALPYYERFLERFPNVKTLAEAPEEEVLRLWAGLGYYSRARNLQKAAQQVVERHRGEFPETLEAALALTGIGNYTAAAILSIAYEKKLAVLDGNVARVLARLGGIRGDLRTGPRWQELQKSADTLLAPERPGEWNEAMMELGATVCAPRSPQCLLCPVGQFCEARKLGLTEVIPEKRLKRENVEITLAALVLVDAHGRTLLLPPPKARRNAKSETDVGALFSRMWHFPTIQVKADAKKELATFVRTEITAVEDREEKRTKKSNAQTQRAQRNHRDQRRSWEFEDIPKVRHTVTYREITVLPFRVEVKKLPRVAQSKIVALDDISCVPVSNLTRKVAHAAGAGREEERTKKPNAEAQRIQRNHRKETGAVKTRTSVIDSPRGRPSDPGTMLF